jgi:C1A family cysteine protease
MIEALLVKFGQPAAILPKVDLRPQFFQLELGVKNQGRRPSCAIFAIVSALEFQNAVATGKVEKFSEEYLSWAVRKTVQRLPAAGSTPPAPSEGQEDADDGFALSEVVAALRAYGIPLQSSMPNTFGSKIDAIEEPPPAVIDEARNHQKVFVHQLPGRDTATRLNNIVQTLNAGFPVAVGMAWPNYRTIRNGYLNGQIPMANSGHAVTLVGYMSTTGHLEDAVFIFKNSWGTDWGQGGYGTVTYGYLSKHLSDAVLLEIQPAKI